MIFAYRMFENKTVKDQIEKDIEELEKSNKKLDLDMSLSKVSLNVDEVLEEIITDPDRIDIEPDYYSISFVSFLKFYQAKHKILRSDLSNIFYNVLFVFFMQMIIVALIGI